jgi:hypothetical protein
MQERRYLLDLKEHKRFVSWSKDVKPDWIEDLFIG